MEVMKAWTPNKAYPKGLRRGKDNDMRIWRFYIVTPTAGFGHVAGEMQRRNLRYFPFVADDAGKCPILSERDKPPLRSAF